jgi:hypothetical protein
MTTVHNGSESVIRPRRRPASTSQASRETRKIFGPEIIKNLPIPVFIDQYNHYMNGVDIADQIRASYTSQRRHYQTWKPLWHFLIDTMACNCYKLSTYGEPGHIQRSSHRRFLADLTDGLLQRSSSSTNTRPYPPTRTILREHVKAVDIQEHRHIRLPGKGGYCKACQEAGREVTPRKKRRVFTELSAQSIRIVPDTIFKGRRVRTPRTLYGCDVCKVFLCKNGDCWSNHLDTINVIN